MKKNGFTLIELAIVLMIIGLVIGGGFKLLKAQREKEKSLEAKEYVKTAKENLVGFAMGKLYLPDWETFKESLSPINSPDLNKSFFYFPSDDLVPLDPNNPDVDICSYNSTTLTLKVYNGANLVRTVENVAFVLAAQGPNGNIQTNAQYDNANSKWIVKTYLANSKRVDDNGYDYTNPHDYYDDIVDYEKLESLQEKIDCKENRLKILNDSSIDGNSTTIYRGQIYADKGAPFDDGPDADNEKDYKWCIGTFDSDLVGKLKYECGGTNDIIDLSLSSCQGNFVQCTTPKLNLPSGTSISPGTYGIKVFLKDQSMDYQGDVNVSKTLPLNIQ